jgi:hypothetical protein
MSEQIGTGNTTSSAPRRTEGQPGDPIAWFRKLSLGADAENGDLAHGQVVIVAARWVLVAAGLVLALWNPASIGPLRLQVLVLLLIAVANFFLHAQLLRKRGAVDGIAYLASGADLAVITLLVASQDGFDSNLFVFYFPAKLALSVAFQPQLTAVYVGATMGLYALICFQSLGLDLNSDHVQTIVVRLLMLAGIAVCGALYQKVERERRAGETMPDELLEELMIPVRSVVS